MQRKVHPCTDSAESQTIGYMIMCPACGNGHLFSTVPGSNGVGGRRPVWSFNGDMDRPTFAPSMMVRGTRMITDDERDRILAGEHVEPEPFVCHSFVRDGRIEFLADCSHSLAGQTVDLKAW